MDVLVPLTSGPSSDTYDRKGRTRLSSGGACFDHGLSRSLQRSRRRKVRSLRYDGPVDSAPRARASSAKSAARKATPRRGLRLVVGLAGLGALLLLGWGALVLRRAHSRQAQAPADGVLLAQRRAGELPMGGSAPVAPPRSPRSSLPASPTPLPMPGAQPARAPRPRYVIGDSAPARPAPGHLFVDAQPQAQVLIDGEAKGKTPLDLLVGSGRKTLRLEAPGFQPIRETFEAGGGAVIRRALVPLTAPP